MACLLLPPNIYAGTITSSQNVSISARVGPEEDPFTVGGGGGIIGLIRSSISFTGFAFPYANVHLYKDGQIVTSTLTDINADFNFNVKNLTSGTYIFTIFAKDMDGGQSAVYTLPIFIDNRVNIKVDNVFLSPSINLSKNNITLGESSTVSGYTTPNSKVTIYFESALGQVSSFNVWSDNFGKYEYTIDSSYFGIGQFKIKAQTEKDGVLSFEGVTLVLNILDPEAEVLPEPTDYPLCQTIFADLNCDQKVNLIDFSIMAYWYNNKTPPVLIDLNKDSQIDLSDFSILAFNWTG